MFDPILSLAISMQSNPGIYAVLTGSGVSRSAGIPTGWEIVLSLIEKLARLMNETAVPDPSTWYRERFGVAPDYSALLDELCKSSAERQQLLRQYFEPSDEEREQGLKVPTAAHHAIARLVSEGYVRVIVTTNFDRLHEEALELLGVIPTVVSSSDHIQGALPLVHTKCTVIKVNGDYLDTRLKNTASELSRYDSELDALLDRILDEHGLVVSGWSSKWDLALKAAIDRCGSHRFTTFWTHRGKLETEAKVLLDRRRATQITIKDANSFFQDLSEKVTSLKTLDTSHPLSPQVATATLKRFLSEERFRITARDFVIDETDRLTQQLTDEHFPLQAELVTPDDVKERVHRYEALIEVVKSILITGCYWGQNIHEPIWTDVLERTANLGWGSSGINVYVELKKYPALLLMYAGGIAAVAAKNYGNVAALLIRAKGENRSLRRDEPISYLVDPDDVLYRDLAQQLVNPGQKNYTPANDYLFRIMRNSFNNLIPRDPHFESCFDTFEYLFALTVVDLREQFKMSHSWVVGSFLWRDRKHYDFKETTLEKLYAEIAASGADWPGLRAGLFGGSFERLQAAQKIFDEGLPRLRQELRIW